jgi:hypothetical protein
MPLGEILSEIGLEVVFEIIFYGITYPFGFLILKILSLGRLPIARFSTIQTGSKKLDWTIWIYSPQLGKQLKAESACLVGAVFLVFSTVGIYWFFSAQ